jgi:transcriptional regulator with XRE-family HTH domain
VGFFAELTRMNLPAIAKSTNIGTMRLNEKLQKLCDEQGLDSQRDLARLAKLSKSSVSRWVNGETRPRMLQALMLARALKVPLEYLIDDAMEEVPAVLPPDEQFVLRVYRNLKADPAQRLDEDEAQRRLSRPSEAQIRAQAKPTLPPTTRDGKQGQELPKPKRPSAGKGRAG